MSKAKEIKVKIKNIKSTEKITRTMEMISASKMVKAQKVMHASQPFAIAITEVISNLSSSCLDKHDFFIKRSENNIGLLVVGSDRGLCGGLNINLFKKCYSSIQAWQHNNSNAQIKVAIIGEKTEQFFNKKVNENINIVASIVNIKQKPKMQDFIGVVQVLMQEYKAHKIDSLYMAYNEFENIMKQNPIIKQLLPITTESFEIKDNLLSTEYIFEPNANKLVDLLLNRYLESLIYHGVLENVACEQSARMIAMKSATDNAVQMVDDLQISFNKERQQIITKEISEIVGGAVAV